MELIKINKETINNELIDTVCARDLHKFLEINSRFNDWISVRIKNYGFQLSVDYGTLTENLVSGGNITHYYITIDMAKELSMIERNEKGKQARKYFIECEKKLKDTYPKALPDFNDPVASARAWADAKEAELKSKLELHEAQPKIEFHDKVGDSTGLLNIGQTAKMLNYGRNNFFKELRSEGFFFGTEPYQVYINSGYFEVKTTESNGHIQKQAFCTPKGLIWLQKRLK